MEIPRGVSFSKEMNDKMKKGKKGNNFSRLSEKIVNVKEFKKNYTYTPNYCPNQYF